LAALYFQCAVVTNLGIDSALATDVTPPARDNVHLNGCPVRLTPTCLMMADKNGVPYEISSAPASADPRGTKAAPPSPDRHLVVSLDGIVAEGMIGNWKRGVLLKDIRWHYSREKCSVVPAKQ
jgi:hypothetical protein